MGDYELTQAKQKAFSEEKMREMIRDAEIYGQGMSTMERDTYMGAAGDGNMAQPEGFQALQKRISEMMLVDVESAKQLKEDFPEAYAERKKEKKRLQKDANISGMDKLKHDTFGTKRSAAKKKLAKIAAEKQKLKEKRSNDRHNLFHDLKADAELDIEKAKKEYAAIIESKKKAGKTEEATLYEQKLYFLTNGKSATAGECMITLYNAQDQNAQITLLQDAFFKQSKVSKVSTKLDEKNQPMKDENGMPVQEVQTKQYDGTSLYRDVARFIIKLEDIRPANDPMNPPAYHKIEQAKVDEMLEYADAMHVMETGAHANGEFEKDVKGRFIPCDKGYKMVPASMEEQENAFYILFGKIDETVDSLVRIEQNNATLFNAPTTESVIKNFDLLSDVYKKLQVTAYTIRHMLRSDFVKGGNVPQDIMEKFIKMFYFVAGMKAFANDTVGHVTVNARKMVGLDPLNKNEFEPLDKSHSLAEKYKVQKAALKNEFKFDVD